MKFALISDAHLDFKNATANLMLVDLPDVDVMVIAGDLVEIQFIEAALPFLRACNEKYEKTIWIPGNHEFYGSDINCHDVVHRYLHQNGLERIFYTSHGVTMHHGVKFVCGTLWTDFGRDNPLVEMSWKTSMNDAVAIRDSEEIDERVSSRTLRKLFDNDLDLIKRSIAAEPCVVVTHHAPSYQSISVRYMGQMNNAYYVSNLDDLLMDSENILCWCHGHLHEAVDYVINQTRVVSNPVGYYGYEKQAKNFSYKIIEVQNQ